MLANRGQEGRGEEEEEEEQEAAEDGTEERRDAKEDQGTTGEVRKKGGSSSEFFEALFEHALEMQQVRRTRFLQQRFERRQAEGAQDAAEWRRQIHERS
jgi:hypothetical protein